MTACKAMASVCVLVGLVAGTANAVTIATVAVGDAGNAADTAAHSGNPAGQGAVSYSYRIGTYDVTAGQYAEFLNGVAKTDPYGLYNPNMWSDNAYGCQIQRSGLSGSYTYSVASDYANRPVNYVNYWDACRFTNWLSNGQGNGSTETGTYTLTSMGTANNTITRNANWKWAVTSEDEWYKAGYYKGGSTDAGYWNYPTYADQGASVWQWNEVMLDGSNRGLRSGPVSGSGWASSIRYYSAPAVENYDIGFRVSEVPEPATIMMLALAGVGIIRRRKA